MTSLRENAAVLSGRVAPADDLGAAQLATVELPAEDLPDLNIPAPDEDGPEMVPVHIAWLRVRMEIGHVGKNDEFKENNSARVKYNFRGIDRVLNAFGPASLRHGVSVLPVNVNASYRDTKSSGGSAMRECTVLVTYRIYGPMGDFIEIQSAGEALDTFDKGTPKALSTALRSLLLLGGLLPTDDPDPELMNIERGEANVRSPQSYLAEILDGATSQQRLWQIRQELFAHRQAGAMVPNERGENEAIGELVDRIGKQRFAPKPQSSQQFCDRCEQPGHHPDACPTLNGGVS
jgi:hypothetical protein